VNQQRATVVWNRTVAPGYRRMGLEVDGYGESRPGQFVMARTRRSHAPLLRRPFSIHRRIDRSYGLSGIEVLYRVVGEGTRILSGLAAGAEVELVGPLGRGFRIPPDAVAIDVAAGGIGVAPMPFLLEDLRSRMDLSACRVFLGGRTREDLLCREDFEAMGLSVTLTTDDGSEGDQCLLTHPLEAAVARKAPDLIVACGPTGMLGCVAGIARRFGVACQVSLESAMACGIGACLGCAVRPAAGGDGYLHVCKDGPVFDVREVAV
jgi:dihydroorotate dehydrogenase electron transfer subunit